MQHKPVAAAAGPKEGNALTHIAICVPARNEAERLPALFDAMARQSGPLSGRVRMCLFLDGCTDASGTVAGAWAARLPFPLDVSHGPRAPANAGRARAAAMALGLAGGPAAGGLLLTTDADSIPRPDWIAANAAALATADVVAGRILRVGEAPSPLQDRLDRYYDRLFAWRRRLDPVAWEAELTHHATGGASLGFRAEAYRTLGGFRPLAAGEDARIIDDAARAGFRVRRDAGVVVETSARRHGRAPGGLAAGLAALDGPEATVHVAHPADAGWQYRMQAQARASFTGGEARLAKLAVALGLTVDHLVGVERDCPSAEAFAMRLVPAPPGGMRQVSLTIAEAALDRLEAEPMEAVA